MTTIEGNKLIAEFIGGLYNHVHDKEYITFDPVTFGDMSGSYGCYLSNLNFDSSWSWLMPVVEKIEGFDSESVDCRFKIERYECMVYYNTVGMIYEQSNGGTSKINSVWRAVVQFIQWYNDNKQ